MELKAAVTNTYVSSDEVREETSWRRPAPRGPLTSANPLETKVGRSKYASSGQSVPFRKVETVGRFSREPGGSEALAGSGTPPSPSKADTSAQLVGGTSPMPEPDGGEARAPAAAECSSRTSPAQTAGCQATVLRRRERVPGRGAPPR